MQRTNCRRTRHPDANPNEWNYVHRRPLPPMPPPVSSGSEWVEPLLKIGLWVAAIVIGGLILMEILKVVLPILMLSWAFGIALKFFGRR
jgi:hypothetical protein